MAGTERHGNNREISELEHYYKTIMIETDEGPFLEWSYPKGTQEIDMKDIPLERKPSM
ncbi:hypothetical protein CHS0354_000308, partial [Potamilus streckersoni]